MELAEQLGETFFLNNFVNIFLAEKITSKFVLHSSNPQRMILSILFQNQLVLSIFSNGYGKCSVAMRMSGRKRRVVMEIQQFCQQFHKIDKIG